MNSEGRTRVILESVARSNESNEVTSFKKYNSCVSFEMTSFFIRQNFTGVARKEGGEGNESLGGTSSSATNKNNYLGRIRAEDGEASGDGNSIAWVD